MFFLLYKLRDVGKGSIMIEGEAIRKALVGLAIERALFEIGTPELDKVIRMLESDFNCSIFDCYSYPEYLNFVLKKLYGHSYDAIVESIKKKLTDFSHQEPISQFISRLVRAG